RGTYITTIGAERFGECSHLQGNLGLLCLHEIRAPTAAHNAKTMGVVREEPGVVLLCERGKPVQWRQVAVHGKDAVGRNKDAPVASAQLGKQHFYMPYVAVMIRDHSRAREARAAPQAGMGQFV